MMSVAFNHIDCPLKHEFIFMASSSPTIIMKSSFEENHQHNEVSEEWERRRRAKDIAVNFKYCLALIYTHVKSSYFQRL